MHRKTARFIPGQSRDALAQVVGEINDNGSGIVRWQRASASDGSGRDREAGQFDSRPVTKAWLNDNGNGVFYLFFMLDESAGKGSGMRKVRIDTLMEVAATIIDGTDDWRTAT